MLVERPVGRRLRVRAVKNPLALCSGCTFVSRHLPSSSCATAGDSTRVQHRLETERQQIEETAARELRRLGENLNAVASDALRTIEADTAVVTRRLSALLMRAWLRPLLVGLSLFLIICGGSWATMHWLSRAIHSRIETLAVLQVNIKEARETLAQMEQTTWGVTLREINGERFVVLLAGSLTNPPWTVGERPAAKLSRKWRSCMTALEQQLTTALRRLSEQFAQE